VDLKADGGKAMLWYRDIDGDQGLGGSKNSSMPHLHTHDAVYDDDDDSDGWWWWWWWRYGRRRSRIAADFRHRDKGAFYFDMIRVFK